MRVLVTILRHEMRVNSVPPLSPLCAFFFFSFSFSFLWQFTFGFSRLPTPGQMRASLADQLEVEDLRRKFRKYAAGRVAPELPDFYKVYVLRSPEYEL